MARTFYKAIITDADLPARETLPGNMLKGAEFLRLWDVYSPLLTPRRREIADLYFNYDLSLGEIAEQKGVSRQSVSDCLHKCRLQLEEYEEKLGFFQALREASLDCSRLLTRVTRWAEAQREKHPEWGAELDGLTRSLSEILSFQEPEEGNEAGKEGETAGQTPEKSSPNKA